MDRNRFGSALARAQKLMLDEDFNAKVEGMANSFANRKGGGMSGNDLKMFEQVAFGDSSANANNITLLESNDGGGEINMGKLDKLPDVIKESFIKQPPMSGDGVDNTPLGIATQQLIENTRKSAPVRQAPVVQTPVSGGIDYSLIKSLIDESVARNLKEILGNGMLNESAAPRMMAMAIKSGNKFQFLDSKGNIYEGVLKLKKKAEQ